MKKYLILIVLMIAAITYAADTSYTVVVTANPPAGGRVYGGSTWLKGSQVPLHAIASSGYVFSNWTENGISVNSNPDCYIMSITRSRNLVANFAVAAPVELISFSSSVTRHTVTLKWRTATEINNYGFEIERSTNGKLYKKVGFVAGHGTTNNYHDYQFAENPNVGSCYYRLKQVDNNGDFKYSKTIFVVIYATNNKASE